MVRLFKDAQAGLSPSDKLMPRRNWCSVITQPASEGGQMSFQLRVEPQGAAEVKDFHEFNISAPLLQKTTGGAATS
jgi:hypothetical protein